MKRIEWIDSLKGFCIFYVTFVHLACHQMLEMHIRSFIMFLFFFLSGFLHNNSNGNTLKYIAKKTKTIFLPFLVWNVLSCAVGLILGDSFYDTFRLFFLLDGEVCWNSPIWSLLLLYMTCICFFFIEKLPYGKYICIPVLLALWVFLPQTNVLLKLNILPPCLLFYALGNVFKPFYEKYSEPINKKRLIPVLAAIISLGLSILFSIVLNHTQVTYTGGNFGNAFLCFIGAVFSILFYVIVFQSVPFLKSNKLLSYLGKNTLIIMASQYWFFKLYDMVSRRLYNFSIRYYRNTLKAFLGAVITIAIICVIAEFLKKVATKYPRLRPICTFLGINMY